MTTPPTAQPTSALVGDMVLVIVDKKVNGGQWVCPAVVTWVYSDFTGTPARAIVNLRLLLNQISGDTGFRSSVSLYRNSADAVTGMEATLQAEVTTATATLKAAIDNGSDLSMPPLADPRLSGKVAFYREAAK